MQKRPLSVLTLFATAALILAGCSSPSYELTEKYAAVIGQHYRLRTDAYIWKAAAHQYDFIPYQLVPAGSDAEGTRLELIPAGTILTIKAAKRSYVGGDWDYVLGEIRAPGSGTVYQFEQLLGSSTSFPGDVARFWEPVDPARVPAPGGKDLLHAPNGRFSIRQSAFTSPVKMSTVQESGDPSSVAWFFDAKDIVRIDYWRAPAQPLAKWTKNSAATNAADRLRDGALAFVREKTPHLQELKVLSLRSSAELGGDRSAIAFRLEISRGEYAGTLYRGLLCFAHGPDTYVLHYQTGSTFATDAAAGEAVLQKLASLREALVFHPAD